MEEQTNGSSGLSIAAMVLGIVALVLSCIWYISGPCAIVAIILAAVSIKDQKPGKNMAIAGLVCSIIALVLTIILVIVGVAALSSMGAL